MEKLKNNKKLIFEGEYLNGLRWNGKIYDKNKKIINEINNGEYIKKDNYEFVEGIKESDRYNKELSYENLSNYECYNCVNNSNYYEKIFEYKYLNEKKDGKVKAYYNNGNIKFEDEYLNGKKMVKWKNIFKVVY